MKFDIARVWKDEAYRQILSEEQLNILPANPAGELTDTELVAVNGGSDHDNGFGFASSTSAANSNHRHTFSGLCDINIFSLDKAHILWVGELLQIANCKKQVCINSN